MVLWRFCSSAFSFLFASSTKVNASIRPHASSMFAALEEKAAVEDWRCCPWQLAILIRKFGRIAANDDGVSPAFQRYQVLYFQLTCWKCHVILRIFVELLFYHASSTLLPTYLAGGRLPCRMRHLPWQPWRWLPLCQRTMTCEKDEPGSIASDVLLIEMIGQSLVFAELGG